MGGSESSIMDGAPLKEDVGQENYDVRFTATLASGNSDSWHR
jgi:hypothetical protein